MLIDHYKNAGVNFLSTDIYVQDPRDETAEGFITEYYQQREKGDAVFRFAFSRDIQPFSKASHTMSAFLLGMHFKELVEERVCNLLSENTWRIKNDFEYPWFLCCLYHDVYSQYEKDHKNEARASFAETKLHMEIDHDIYTEEMDILENRGLPLSYAERTVKEYYQQRFRNGKKKYGNGTADHGILSGYYCYDRLVKNYLRHRKAYGKGHDHFEEPNKNGQRLAWDKDQIWVFGLAADAIIAHNIWHTPEYSNILQLCPGGPRERKLSIEETPLAYFLSLIDTIEPIKWFASVQKDGEKHSEWDVLRHIDMKMQNGIISITQDYDVFNFEKWFIGKDMENIQTWLKNTTARLSPNKKKITIELPTADE